MRNQQILTFSVTSDNSEFTTRFNIASFAERTVRSCAYKLIVDAVRRAHMWSYPQSAAEEIDTATRYYAECR